MKRMSEPTRQKKRDNRSYPSSGMYQTEVLIYLHANKVYHDFSGTATKTF